MKTTFLALLLLGALSGCVSPTQTTSIPSKVEVVFQNPEKFTDIKDSAMATESGQQDILNQLKEFIISESNTYIPINQKLTIVFTDIDLAGDYEPWRGFGWDNVRIVKSIYPPHFCFSWKLTDSEGKVLKNGLEDIRDLAFDMRVTSDRLDSLHIEKDILKDWFRAHFN